MKISVMAPFSWISILGRPALSRADSSSTIPGMWVWPDGVTAAPFPKKRPPTFRGYWLLVISLILCLQGSFRIAQSAISPPLLTTSGMSCTVLEKQVRQDFLSQGCIPQERVRTPNTYIVSWTCKEEPERLWAMTWAPPPELDNWCITRKDTCLNIGQSLYVTDARARHGHEHCEFQGE